MTSFPSTDEISSSLQFDLKSKPPLDPVHRILPNKKENSLQVVVCPVCESKQSTVFYQSEGLPVHCCVLHEDFPEAVDAKKGNVQLRFCPNCEFVFNSGFDPNILDFQPGYDASLTFSPTFRTFSESVADRLVQKYDLHGKNAIEIGCGEGYFLNLLAAKGGNTCVGFDPTIKNPEKKSVSNGSVTTIRDYYRETHRTVPCDFLCCLSVMEDLQNPNVFVREVADLLGDRSVDCYFEIFNGMKAIEELHTWSVLYEQCNYFSAKSFAHLFQRNGFNIHDFGTCYQQGEYLFVEASWNGEKNQRGSANLPNKCSAVDDDCYQSRKTKEKISQFESSHLDQIRYWNEVFEKYSNAGQQGVVWGTGGKGVSFLNAMKGHAAIFGAVDINPRRSGKYVPGSGYKIMTPENLRTSRPAFIVVTNPLYEDEIRKSVEEMGINCDFYTT